jgi:hypothetical protein
MRGAFFLSILAHLAAAALFAVPWPQMDRTEARGTSVVPIDIVIGEVTDVAALAPPLEEPEEIVLPEEALEEPEMAAAPATAAPPTPRDTQRPPPPPRTDPSDLRRRLNANRDAENPTPDRPDNAQDSDRIREGAGRSAGETAELTDYFAALGRAHVRRNQCWTDPIGRTDAANLQIFVEVRLTRQGRIAAGGVGRPRVGQGTAPQALLDDAVRAVRACDLPYPFAADPQGPPNYDLWREIELCFGAGCRTDGRRG